ncbi:hypothetical protein [Lihuaxuella thermophila]|uniref:Uncharacterized protein n=1 Tax=Lihuaxuella thermophila TaxID=1173111 RepID=A0A1H8GQY7_9BACL|nr:hypothetical protein [Lihuaxuella thermophila]SEN46230.1 hypothetical protein SAMN05444955_11217 [Lihuaxuella thermophila]
MNEVKLWMDGQVLYVLPPGAKKPKVYKDLKRIKEILSEYGLAPGQWKGVFTAEWES